MIIAWHRLQQHYVKLQGSEKNRKLFDLLDLLEFNQVSCSDSDYTELTVQDLRCSFKYNVLVKVSTLRYDRCLLVDKAVGLFIHM